MKKVLILLATYNGKEYIEEQINSILKQTYKNIELIISDDNSNDETIDIIEKIREKDKRIEIFKSESTQGILKNFNKLINIAKTKKYDYIMLSDQDDVWKKDKVEKSLKLILEIEQKKSLLPILVYTNLELVDKNLKKLEMKIRYKKETIRLFRILHQNPIYGCTMMLNKKLIDSLEESFPEEFIHHDYYITFIAFLMGEIYHLDEECIFYRQHGKNNSGSSIKNRTSKFFNIPNLERNVKQFYELSNLTLKKYSDYISDIEKVGIKKILRKDKYFIFYLLKYKVFKISFLGTINFWKELLIEKYKSRS